MKIRYEQEQLANAGVRVRNLQLHNFNGLLTGRGPQPRESWPTTFERQDRSSSNLTQALHLGQVMETVPCSAVLEERNRMAREIHDTLAQEFAGILLHLEAANSSYEPKTASESLARARELAKCGLEDARRILLGLRPKSLEGAHLSDALGQLAQSFSRDCGINCTFRANGRAHQLPEEIENELYRVAQEALCNVRKHSHAASVSILLNYRSSGVVLAIKDNGQGLPLNRTRPARTDLAYPQCVSERIAWEVEWTLTRSREPAPKSG